MNEKEFEISTKSNINNDKLNINKKVKPTTEIKINQDNISNKNKLIPKSQPKNNYTNEISEQEIHALVKFKEHCALSGLEYRFDIYNNDILLRLLRSRKYNIPETYKAFIEFINFTKKYDAFNIQISIFPNMDKIRLFYPHGFHKTTITGEPVFI